MQERDLSRFMSDSKTAIPMHGQSLLNSKSVPTLHRVGNVNSKYPN